MLATLRLLLIPDLKKLKEIFTIALPVVFGMSTYTILLAVDTAFLGQISPTAQAVAGIGDISFLVLSLSLGGLAVGTQVLVARRLGENNLKGIGEIADNAVWLSVVLGGGVTILLSLLLPHINNSFYESEELRVLGKPFLEVKFLGIGFFMLMAAGRGFFVGIGETFHFFVSALIRSAVNIFLDYALIFGKFGLPEMGIQGAAWAGTIALFLASAYLLGALLLSSYRTRFFLLKNKVSWSLCKRIFNLSIPAGLRHFIGLGSYLIFFRIIEGIGTGDLAVANIARSVFNIQFMPILGIGFAVSTLVSKNIGAGTPSKSEGYVWRAMQISLWLVVILYSGMAIFAEPLAGIFTNDNSVLDLAAGNLQIGGLFLLLLPIGMIFISALEGAGNIWLILLMEGVLCILYLILAYLFGVSMHGGVIGAQTSEIVYWLLLGWASGSVFLLRKWHKTKV